MPVQLKVGPSRVWMHKGVIQPGFGKLHVLSNDPWQYVELSLKRSRSSDALSYWVQARRFAEASEVLSTEAAPLTLYYSLLNAARALLSHKNMTHTDKHGVSGERPENARLSLKKEIVKFQSGGVPPTLCTYFKESSSKNEYRLRDILWNIPFIHRSFCLSFTSSPELFIPLEKACYVRHDETREAWFQAEVVPRYSDGRILRNIPRSFDTRDCGGKTLIFRRRRFNCFLGRVENTERENALKRLENYHSTTRRVIVNISGDRDLWYLKKDIPTNSLGFRHTITLMFAAMHRLSELSRYDPSGLDRHLTGRANWLITEFVNHALDQFIDQIASEITGFQFWPPKMRS